MAWIDQNRIMLFTHAMEPTTRRIYIGDGFIYELLVLGKFPGTQTDVPRVGRWLAMSPKIKPQRNLRDHWHISKRFS